MHIDGAPRPSPSHPVASESAAVRWSTRADLQWPVELVVNDLRIDAVTQNVGPQGAYVRCPKPFGLDEVFELCLRIPGADRPIRASARVIWSKKFGRDDVTSPQGMGVHFCGIEDDDRAVIRKAVLDSIRATERAAADPT